MHWRGATLTPSSVAATARHINHSANADRIGEDLRPNTLIIFGNPNVGTVLMQNQQTIGIDLPLKYLVWEDSKGTARITYNDPDHLANRHKVKGLNDTLGKISNALGRFAAEAAE